MSSLHELRERFFKREIQVNSLLNQSWVQYLFSRTRNKYLVSRMLGDMSMMERGLRHTYRALGLKARLNHFLLLNDYKWIPTHFHRKRKSKYLLIGVGNVQNSSGIPLVEGEDVAVYQDRQGRLWVRRESEFEDGRFGSIAAEGYDPDEGLVADT